MEISAFFVDAKKKTLTPKSSVPPHHCAKQTEDLHSTPFRHFHGRISTQTQKANNAHTQQKDSAHQHDGVIGASTNPLAWWRAACVLFEMEVFARKEKVDWARESIEKWALSATLLFDYRGNFSFIPWLHGGVEACLFD